MANRSNTEISALIHKRSKRTKENKEETMSRATYSAGFFGGAVKRIRTPNEHDVLLGRGGGINSHEGNVQFRSWVADRKNDYNLAPNKAEKARVAREVIASVQVRTPQGRFLQKDPTCMGGPSWWVEVDDEKMMAKTSQALREGAPQIRAAHKDELQEIRSKKSTIRRPRKPSPERTLGFVQPELAASISLGKPAIAALRQNMDEARDSVAEEQPEEQPPLEEETFERPVKRVRLDYNGRTVLPTDETPPLMPLISPDDVVPLDPTLMPQPAVMRTGLVRSHSLALSDVSYGEWNIEEFVNPFENEKDLLSSRESTFSPTPRPGVLRDTSVASDLGGYGALLKSDPVSRYYSAASDSSTGVRLSRTNSSSSRYGNVAAPNGCSRL
jgi:hypothetical protein